MLVNYLSTLFASFCLKVWRPFRDTLLVLCLNVGDRFVRKMFLTLKNTKVLDEGGLHYGALQP